MHFFFQFLIFLGYQPRINVVNHLVFASRSLNLTLETLQLLKELLHCFFLFQFFELLAPY